MSDRADSVQPLVAARPLLQRLDRVVGVVADDLADHRLLQRAPGDLAQAADEVGRGRDHEAAELPLVLGLRQALDDLAHELRVLLLGRAAGLAPLNQLLVEMDGFESNDGVILVAGSARLVQGLIANDLLDELRLMIFPVILGGGKRLFADDGRKVPLKLTDARTVGAGIQLLTYDRG